MRPHLQAVRHLKYRRQDAEHNQTNQSGDHHDDLVVRHVDAEQLDVVGVEEPRDRARHARIPDELADAESGARTNLPPLMSTIT